MKADPCKNCAWCVETTLSEIVKGHPVIVRHCRRYAPSNTDGRWPKVDLKSNNTYVVGPGSTSVSGVVYEPINNLPIAAAPDQLVAACGRPHTIEGVKVTRPIPEVTSIFAMPTVERLCDEMRATNTRNNTLHRTTCLLLRSGWAGKDSIVMLAAAAADAGLGAEEIQRTIDSAWGAVMADG